MKNASLNPINHWERGEAGARGRIFRTKNGQIKIQQFWLMSFILIPWDALFLGKQQFFLEKTPHTSFEKSRFFFFLEKTHMHSQVPSCSTRRDQQLELGGAWLDFWGTPSPWSNSKRDLTLRWQWELEGFV